MKRKRVFLVLVAIFVAAQPVAAEPEPSVRLAPATAGPGGQVHIDWRCAGTVTRGPSSPALETAIRTAEYVSAVVLAVPAGGYPVSLDCDGVTVSAELTVLDPPAVRWCGAGSGQPGQRCGEIVLSPEVAGVGQEVGIRLVCTFGGTETPPSAERLDIVAEGQARYRGTVRAGTPVGRHLVTFSCGGVLLGARFTVLDGNR
ncbi:hypothetical protein [Amycolatopsis nigrescens]|uniref:hypothetical protein n=1 Tax=Amycolatopsis nigrescens TaxID=381445 RepID=UPI000363E7F3|nr:hypothetical protein [Amycolatopsis nigrescens]